MNDQWATARELAQAWLAADTAGRMLEERGWPEPLHYIFYVLLPSPPGALHGQRRSVVRSVAIFSETITGNPEQIHALVLARIAMQAAQDDRNLQVALAALENINAAKDAIAVIRQENTMAFVSAEHLRSKP